MKKMNFSWKNNAPVIFSVLLIIVLMMIPTGYESKLAYQNADRVRAEVISTDNSDIIDNGLLRTGEQRCEVKILGGRFKGEVVTAVNRLNGSLAQDKIFSNGDTAFIVISHNNDEIISALGRKARTWAYSSSLSRHMGS